MITAHFVFFLSCSLQTFCRKMNVLLKLMGPDTYNFGFFVHNNANSTVASLLSREKNVIKWLIL